MKDITEMGTSWFRRRAVNPGQMYSLHIHIFTYIFDYACMEWKLAPKDPNIYCCIRLHPQHIRLAPEISSNTYQRFYS